MALSLESLEVLDAIERKGSFAAAAHELGKVPSALTYVVRKLEDDLDVLLFDRRRHRAELTPAAARCWTKAATCCRPPTSWPAASSAWPPAGKRR